jgi:hypothetical protein
MWAANKNLKLYFFGQVILLVETKGHSYKTRNLVSITVLEKLYSGMALESNYVRKLKLWDIKEDNRTLN